MALTRFRTAVCLALAAAIGLSVAPSRLRADGVTAALLPTGQTVPPGTEFDLDLLCTEAGDLFNAFKAVVSWDPAALTFIRLSPLSAQEGSYLKGPPACGSTYHVFGQGASTDTISDALLCNGIYLAGPGQLYRLRFRASSTPQATAVRLLSLQFFRAGTYVNPVHASGAVVGIGVPAGVDEPAVGRLALSVAPNPGRGALQLTVGTDRAGLQRLTVRDVQGRRVRRLAEGWSAAGSRVVTWDGLDDAGARLAAGVYLVTLDVEGRATSRRVVLLP